MSMAKSGEQSPGVPHFADAHAGYRNFARLVSVGGDDNRLAVTLELDL